MKIALLLFVSFSEVCNYRALKPRISPLLYKYIKRLIFIPLLLCVIKAICLIICPAWILEKEGELCQNVYHFNPLMAVVGNTAQLLTGLTVCLLYKKMKSMFCLWMTFYFLQCSVVFHVFFIYSSFATLCSLSAWSILFFLTDSPLKYY